MGKVPQRDTNIRRPLSKARTEKGPFLLAYLNIIIQVIEEMRMVPALAGSREMPVVPAVAGQSGDVYGVSATQAVERCPWCQR